MTDLKRSTKRAIAWSALDKGGQQFLLLLVGMVTTRLLAPEAFGLFGSLTLYTGVAGILAEGGLSVALIRKTDATERDNNTMFWFNLLLGVLFYLLLYAAAPWIALYNSVPELVHIARVQFLTVVFYSLGQIQWTLLIKRSDFRRLGIVNISSVVLSGATVVILVLLDYGIWALVVQAIVLSASRTILLWVLAGWRPRFTYSRRSFREMFGFSWKIIAGSLANNVSVNFYTSALLRFFPAAQAGFYERGNKVKETGAGFMTHTFGNSIVLMLSQLQHDAARFRQALRKSVRALSFLLFPALLGLAVVVCPLVEIVIGDRWLPSVPYIRILCVSALFAVLNYLYGNALRVKGRSDITLVLDIASAILMVSFLYLTIRYGLRAAAMADAAAKCLVFILHGTAAARVLGYRWRDQLHDLLPYAALAGAMAGAVWGLSFLITDNFPLLFCQIGAGAGFYLLASRLLGSKVLEEIREMLKRGRI